MVADELRRSTRLPDAVRRWSVVSLLMAGMVMSLIDRQIIALLVEPIKADLSLSDTQFSLLVGPAFVAFYLVFGVPFGWAADRFQRRWVIAAGMAIWSLATIGCGLAGGFVMLLFARALVGAGEASLTPASLSIISDLFSRERLPFVTSIFFVSIHIGGAAAMIVGGGILSLLGDADLVAIPIFGALAPWQVAFIIVGAPGLLLALVFATIAEPSRREELDSPSIIRSTEQNVSLRAFLREHRRTIVIQLFSAAALAIGTAGITAWAPAYLIRAHSLPSDTAALGLGVVLLACGPAGTVAGGALSGFLLKQRGDADAPWRVMTISALGTGIFGTTLFLSPSIPIVIAAAIPTVFLGSLYLGVVHAAVQMITPSRLRGRLAAMQLFAMTGIGGMIGPVVVALLTDSLFADPQMVGRSLAVVAGGVGASVAALLGLSLKSYRRSYALANRQ